VLVTTAAIAADHHVMVQPDDLKWASAPPVLPKGAHIAVLYGDRTKPNHSSSGSNSRPATRWRLTFTPTTMT
jgi:hypothetical protein